MKKIIISVLAILFTGFIIVTAENINCPSGMMGINGLCGDSNLSYYGMMGNGNGYNMMWGTPVMSLIWIIGSILLYLMVLVLIISAIYWLLKNARKK